MKVYGIDFDDETEYFKSLSEAHDAAREYAFQDPKIFSDGVVLVVVSKYDLRKVNKKQVLNILNGSGWAYAIQEVGQYTAWLCNKCESCQSPNDMLYRGEPCEAPRLEWERLDK